MITIHTADFDQFPSGQYSFMVGLWDVYRVNNEETADFFDYASEIIDWGNEHCGEFTKDWWYYTSATALFIYLKPRESMIFKLTWWK